MNAGAPEVDVVLSPTAWRQVEALSPRAVNDLLSEVASQRLLAALDTAIEAGLPTSSGVVLRAGWMIRLAATDGGEGLALCGRWLDALRGYQPTPPVRSTGSVVLSRQYVLDHALALACTENVANSAHVAALFALLRSHGARLTGQGLDAQGRALEQSALETILARDDASLLALWYGDDVIFDADRPLPVVKSLNGHKERDALSIALDAFEKIDGDSACAAWFAAHLAPHYRLPLEAMFERSARLLYHAGDKTSPLAKHRMGKMLALGATPPSGRGSAAVASAWQKLLAHRSGPKKHRFPLELLDIRSDLCRAAALVRLFDDGGLDIDDADGGTLLHHAVLHKDTEMVHFLLERGASSSIAPHCPEEELLHGRTAIEIARVAGYAEIETLLAAHAARSAMRAVTEAAAERLPTNELSPAGHGR